jgi:hypothetical protein
MSSAQSGTARDGGRAEIRLTDGDSVFLDENSSVRPNDKCSRNPNRLSAVVITGHRGPGGASQAHYYFANETSPAASPPCFS